jgi:CelD/BcsL family acetyltransferase involved in cellulose biosynthesis
MEALQLASAAHLRPTLTSRPVEDLAWRDFVVRCSEATIFHHPAWARMLVETYGYRPLLLAQEDEAGRIQAGALFLEVRSRLTGRRLVSLPFTDHSPVLARDQLARREFTSALVAWRREARAPMIEVHAALPAMPGVYAAPRGVRHLLPLERSPEVLYRSLKSTQIGRAIRKAERSGIAVRLDRSREAVAQYYRLHCRTRRRQGVPVQPRRFFDRLWSRLIAEHHGFVALAEHRGALIAGAVFLGSNHHLIYKYGASDPRSWELRPNNLLFWKAMEWGCKEGYEVLDFGKTDLENRGLRDFKSRWGASEVPLAYTFVSDRGPEQGNGRAIRVMTRVIRSTPTITGRVVGELLYGHFG